MRDEATAMPPLRRSERRTSQMQPPRPEAPDSRRPLSRGQLLALQRTAGNRATAAVVSRVSGKNTRSARRVDDDDDYTPGGARVLSGRVQKERKTLRGKAARARDRELDGLRAEIPHTYRSQAFGSVGRRVSCVSVPVVDQPTGGRGAAPPPLSEVSRTPEGGSAGQKSGFDGGHVIGLRLGGADDSKNVVPMYRAFNRGPYSTVEAEIRRKAGVLARTGVPVLTVVCGYPTGDADVPTTFTLELTKHTAKVVYVIKTWTLTQPDDIPQIPDLKPGEKALLKGASDALRTGRAKHLPKHTKAAYPDDPAKRFYEHLDLLRLSGKLPVGTEAEAFRGFSSEQRTLILQANRARNGGVLKSDDPADPVYRDQEYHGALDERGADNFPEIDHIIPQVLGGSNAYSNARVVSWRLNNVDARIKPIHDLVDVGRLAAPTVKADKAGYRTVALQYLYRVHAPTQGRFPFTAGQVHAWAATGPAMLFQDLAQKSPARVIAGIRSALDELAEEGTLAASGDRFALPRPAPPAAAPAADSDPMTIAD